MRLSHDEVLKKIHQEHLIAILRGVPMNRLTGVVSALIAGGVRVLEFTFDHDQDNYFATTVEKIRTMVECYGDKVIIGSGTVLTKEEVQAAYDAGACLIVSPDTNTSVIEKTRSLGMVSMPGALTPTEIVKAYNAGADIIKLFPAGELGLGYIKAIHGPLAHIPMSAVGGVKPQNVKDFLDAGICGFGVGGQLIMKKAVEMGDNAAIETRAREFTQMIAAWEAEQ